MTLLLTVLLALAPLTQTTQRFYAAKDVDALRDVCRHATRTEDDLLCRYRLYPLTEDPQYLDNLPDDLSEASPRALALLSGLWGYKTSHAPFHKVPRYGMRAERLMERARAAAPDDPFVLLIDGQSLLFKPALFGGDTHAALARFQRLHDVLDGAPDGGVSLMEADVWRWYALRKLDDAGAEALRKRLLTTRPPRLYHEFLLSPL